MSKFKLAFTFGRFNLLHLGHISLFREMAFSANEIIIGLSTGEKNLSIRDRSQVIRHALNSDEKFTTAYEVQPRRQPFEFAAEIKQHDPSEVILYLGEDQFELAKAFETRLGIQTELIPRMTSSTVIRTLIDNEEWTMLTKLIPLSILNKIVQLRETERCLASH